MTSATQRDAMLALAERLETVVRKHRAERIGGQGVMLRVADVNGLLSGLERLQAENAALRDLLWRAIDDASLEPDSWFYEARAALGQSA